jgi:hypothetical protein
MKDSHVLLSCDLLEYGVGAGAVILLLLLFGMGCVVWILPGVIASMRKHHNQGAIWALTMSLVSIGERTRQRLINSVRRSPLAC